MELKTHNGDETIAERIVDFAMSVPIDVFTTEQLEWASLRFIDTVGVALTAAALDLGTAGARYVNDFGSEGRSSVWAAGGRRVRPDDACLANGMLAHAMDYDDTNTIAKLHPSVVIVPTALAVGESKPGVSGKEILVAAILGYEVSARLGIIAKGQLQTRGFHPTSILGIFGAVTATSRLMGVSNEVALNAMGLAGSMASGLMEYLSDGSDAKQMHPGWAAKGAITAVELAKRGATGPRSVLEGKSGVLSAFGDIHDDGQRVLDTLGHEWLGSLVSTKPYPACHCVHAPVDAWRQLRDRLGLTDDDVRKIRRITGLVPTWYLQLVCDPLDAKQAPRSIYEARFSLPFAIGATAVDGELGIASFMSERLHDERILEVAGRVDYEVHDYAEYPEEFPGGIRIEMEDGTKHEEHVHHNRGSTNNPMSVEDVCKKFRDGALQIASVSACDELLDSLLALPSAASAEAFSRAMANVEARGLR